MSTTEQLHLRALRLLHDDRKHAPSAERWAREQVATGVTPKAFKTATELQFAGFTLREISLGAQ